jgi:peptide/nickel transport system substrate-binding protein
MTSFIITPSWAYDNDLPPIAYDPEAAIALLEEAGWVDDDNDPTTPRVAQGVATAEDGTVLSFSLFTNEGNARRTAVGTISQDQLNQIGFDVNFQTVDFTAMYDIADSQTYDAIIGGWRNGYPDDPDVTQIFTSAGDIPESGSNYQSFNNAEFNELNRKANDATETNGCDPQARIAFYHEMQAIFQEELPYVPLFTRNGLYAATSAVSGFGPYPSQMRWNISSWAVNAP